MKPFSKQTNKWLLSTLLVAALGSQYYFSVSSQSLGTVDMSSTASEQYAVRLKQLENTVDIQPAELEKGKKELNAEFATKIAAEMAGRETAHKMVLEEVKPKSETEAKSVKTIELKCAECSTPVTVTGSEESLKALAAVVLSAKKAETVVAKAEVKKEEVVPETAKQKYERIKQEREDAREEARRIQEEKKEEKEYQAQIKRDAEDEKKQAKLAKEKEKKDALNKAFAEKAESLVKTCNEDLECKVSGFTALLESSTGTSKVDQFAVTKAYNQLIDKDLRAGLNSAPGTEAKVAALNALNSIMADLPSEYKSLKVRTIELTKSAQSETATTINGMYKESKVLLDQRKPLESAKMQQQAMIADQWFRRDADLIKSNLYEGLSSSKDQSTLSYVTNNYLTDIQSMVNRLTNSNGITDSATTSTAGSRAGRTGNTTVINGTTIQNDGDAMGKINFGSPSANRTGTRLGK